MSKLRYNSAVCVAFELDHAGEEPTAAELREGLKAGYQKWLAMSDEELLEHCDPYDTMDRGKGAQKSQPANAICAVCGTTMLRSLENYCINGHNRWLKVEHLEATGFSNRELIRWVNERLVTLGMSREEALKILRNDQV